MPKRKAHEALSGPDGGERVRIAALPKGDAAGSSRPTPAQPGPPGPSQAQTASPAVKVKRSTDSTEGRPSKRAKQAEPSRPPPPPSTSSSQPAKPAAPPNPSNATSKGKGKAADPALAAPDAPNSSIQPALRIRKLIPPRPFPTVPASVSATGPRSAHSEGKNYVCVTRRTPLGAYLRRCHDLVVKDGHKELHLNALGAAIPHLALLATSLPATLPFGPDELTTEIRTGTVEVMDELLPEDEDEDVSYRVRGKSTLSVVLRVNGGDAPREAAPQEKIRPGKSGKGTKRPRGKRRQNGGGATAGAGAEPGPKPIVVQEPEQEEMDQS